MAAGVELSPDRGVVTLEIYQAAPDAEMIEAAFHAADPFRLGAQDLCGNQPLSSAPCTEVLVCLRRARVEETPSKRIIKFVARKPTSD